MSVSTWIGLLLCNLAWSINPSIAKIIIDEVGPQHTAWFKYVAALVTYVIFMIGSRYKGQPVLFMSIQKGKDFLAVIVIGFATCFFSPMTQMVGLSASTAVNNSILVAFEPIFTVLFGWLIFGERLTRSHYLSFFLAITGFLLMSNFFVSLLSKAQSVSAGCGDLILLAAIAGEAIYSVLARRLIKKYPGHVIFGTAMLVGVILLSLVVLPFYGLPAFGKLSLKCWLAVMWLGILGTAVPYLYWLHALNRSLTLGSVVLSLFMQPFFGALIAVLLLGEQFRINQLIGGLIIIWAVVFQVMIEQRKGKCFARLDFPQ